MAFEIQEEGKEMFKCHICNEAEFETKQRLGAHQGHCKLKHPDRLERSTRVPFGTPTQRFSISKEDSEKYERSGETAGTNDDGSEIKDVLMRQPIEMYEADQALKNKQMDKVDKQIQGDNFQVSGALQGSTYKPS